MMVWQIINQIKYLLDQRNWSGSSNRVFGTGSILASAMIPENAKKTLRIPLALVYPGEGQSDPVHGEAPELIQTTINVTIVTSIPGDAVGEKALIGGNVGDRLLSQGRGVLEIEEEVLLAVGSLQKDSGVVIVHQAITTRAPVYDPVIGYIAFRDLTFRAWCTSTRFYHPVTYLTATGGSGQVVLAWAVPPDRYDRFRVVLRRNNTGTAPTSITDGTGVTLSGDLATSVTDSGLSSGTYSYSIFGTFDEQNARPQGTPSLDGRVSDAVSRQAISVT